MSESELDDADTAMRDTEAAAAASDEPNVVIPAQRVARAGFAERYEREGMLGEGGMGAVLLCADRQIGRKVAMKVIRRDRLASGRAEGRFVREARVQGQLEHPAVVPVYDLGVDPDGAIYFTMKRVRGVTLEDIIHRPETHPGFSRHKLLTAFAHVCLAVDFAHRRGVLHRDLKPANVMLGDFGEIYVLDWGLAKIGDQPDTELEEEPVAIDVSKQTAPGSMLGTPGYMSPEQLRGADGLAAPSDVYALGAILFEILTGTPLHDRSSIAAIITSTADGVDARPSRRAPDAEVAPELEAICVRATSLSPTDRYPTARALHDALERYLEGERDVELRRQMARSHAERAALAVEREQSSDGGLDERRAAMRDIGRALALDPDNAAALTTLMKLLTTPPTAVPPEVRAEMKRSTYDQNRSTGRLGAFAYASILLYLPLFWWIGIRDPAPLVWLFAGGLATAAISVWVARQRRPPTRAVLAAMVVSSVSFMAVSTFYGPMIVLPPIIVANTIAFAIHLGRRYRWFAIGCGCAAIVVPTALEALGVLPPSYAFAHGTMTVSPNALDLRESPTMAFVTLVSVASVVTGSLVVGGVRNALREAEERLYLYAWHLRETVPERARPSTDPTRGRRAPASAKS